MDNDLLELVTSVIMKNESYIQRIEVLEIRCKDLEDSNVSLSSNLNILQGLHMNTKNDLYKLKSELKRLFPFTNT